MPGKLFVLARTPNGDAWALLAAAVNAVEAGAAVDAFVAQFPSRRVIVANAIRSFRASVVNAEDAVVTVDP